MAILVVSPLPNLTKDGYEEIRKELNWEASPPPGQLCHIAATEGNGMRVVTAWSSEQDFNNFVNSKLMPAFQKRSIKPQPQIFQIHNFNVFPGIERYRISEQTH